MIFIGKLIIMSVNKIPPGVRVGESAVKGGTNKDVQNSVSSIGDDFSVSPPAPHSSGDVLIDESGYYVLMLEDDVEIELE